MGGQDVMPGDQCQGTAVKSMVSMWLVGSKRDRDEGNLRVRPSAECSIPVFHWAHVAVHHGHGIPVEAELPVICPHGSSGPATPYWLFDFWPNSASLSLGVIWWSEEVGTDAIADPAELPPTKDPLEVSCLVYVGAVLLDCSSASLSHEAVCPGIRPGFGDRVTLGTHHSGAYKQVNRFFYVPSRSC